MSRFQTPFIVFIVFLAIQVAYAEARKPNILFFFSDDLTTQAISAYQYGMDRHRPRTSTAWPGKACSSRTASVAIASARPRVEAS